MSSNFKLTSKFVLPMVILFLLAGCQKESAVSTEQVLKPGTMANSENSSLLHTGGNIIVTGGGTTEEFGEKTTYEFNAVEHNGHATGQIILKFRAADGSIWVSVDCIRLFGVNKATMSGVITRIHAGPIAPQEPPPFIYVGGRVSFTVQDNGQGNSSDPDLVSDIGVLDLFIPASCEDDMVPYLPLNGNLQIIK
jgi:hypothetical protein